MALGTKKYKAIGFIQNTKTMEMLPAEFNVLITKDNHCTLGIYNEQLDLGYSVDFTKILKEILKEEAADGEN